MSNKMADMLDELDFFQDFPYVDLEIIGRHLILQEIGEGEEIFREGDPGNFMLILISGRIAIFKGGEHGRHLLSYEGKGRIVGEMALLDHERRSATCVADTDCDLMTLTQDGLKKLAAESPALGYRFMFCLARLLSKRLRRTSGMMADFLDQ